MHDAQIIAACIQSRKAYDRIAAHISGKDLSPQGAFWWEGVVAWYQRDKDARSADKDILAAEGTRRITNPKHTESLLGYFMSLPDVPSAYNVVQEVLALRRHNKELEYAAAIAGGAPLEKRVKLHREAGELLQLADLDQRELESANDNQMMLQLTDRKNKIAIAPAKLSERTAGGAVAGDHIVIFGRPEAGKSLFAVNMAAGFLRHGHKVLYIGNEENVYKTRHRVLCNLSRMTGPHVERDPRKAVQLAEMHGFGLLDTRQGHPGSPEQIAELLEDVKPTVLVVDQIRNLASAGYEKASLTHKLEHFAIEIRNLLSKYHVIGVSVTQAGDKTERHGQQPPAWLTMSDVDSSRTGLPAQADLLLGIGFDDDMRQRNERAISICKNKMAHTHEGFLVEVDLDRSIVK